MDRYGNRRYDASNTTILGSCTEAVCNPTISTATNRFTSSGWQYDAAGNVTGDAEGKDFIYDAENHQIEVQNDQDTTIGEYRYDGDGKRVKKISSTETTIFVYNASGQLVAEYSTQTSQSPQTSYLTTDHLGSTRLVTDQLGAVKDRKDYGAFGDEIVTSARVSGIGYTSGGDEVRKGYTGYEKDGESGLEFAQARYYSTTHGRYTSVDPLTASASIRNPQTFNRYAYVLNSPYKYVDPLGLISSSTGACGQWCQGNDGGAVGWTQSSDSGWRNGWEIAGAVQQHTDAGIADSPATTSDDSQQHTAAPTAPPPSHSAEATVNLSLDDGIPGNENVGIEVVIWDKAIISLGRQEGHVSYIIDGISYSWQMNDSDGDGKDDYLIHSNPDDYIALASKTSGATGYVLDFGSRDANEAFKKAVINAYKDRGQNYDVLFNNCGAGFARAINQIRGQIGVVGNLNVRPHEHKQYITTTLSRYIVGDPKVYKRTGGGWFK
ncbi:MAG: RHS repeat-associated core domain-containing protein [Pyrinomonadaceae bacterium]|nr:RHS repeat-associated core domain-containing protein [Pyrinomonadaceae bacterium]